MNILSPAVPAEIMQHFDRLPQPLRRAIAGAAFAYDPREIAARLARGARVDRIVAFIERRAAQ